MAGEGLRVLFFAKKELSSIDDDITQGFQLLGCTAVEDLLQDNVKECI